MINCPFCKIIKQSLSIRGYHCDCGFIMVRESRLKSLIEIELEVGYMGYPLFKLSFSDKLEPIYSIHTYVEEIGKVKIEVIYEIEKGFQIYEQILKEKEIQFILNS